MTSLPGSSSQRGARYFLGLLASVAVLTTGCSNMATTATNGASAVSQVLVKGKLHGGNQPVSGAAVTVYFAGQTGYGSASSTAATTTTSSDGYGSFSFTLTCPTSLPYDPLVYIIARGGNTLNNGTTTPNSASVFLAGLSPCSQINSSTFVDMSEVTTVASMAALQQYFNPATESFGVDGILLGYTAMANAMKIIPNLVDYTSGNAVTTLTKTGSASGSTVSVTVTPESAKVNTIANILSACINNNANGDATACSTLESSATPPVAASTSQPNGTFSAAADPLVALYYMMTNPTDGSASNLSAIYALAPPTGAPYQPTLSAAPTDWTIGVTFSSNSSCTNGDGFFDFPYDLKLDSSGNVWVDNGPGSNGNLAHMQFDGTPMECASVASQSRGSTIDDRGNVWVGSYSTNNIYRYTTGGAVLTYTTAAPVVAVTADGNDNVYFSTYAGTALYQIVGGATATAAATPTQISGSLGAAPSQIMVDSSGGSYVTGTTAVNGSGTIWVSSGAATVSQVVVSTNTSDPTYMNGFVTNSYPVSGSSYGISLVPGNAGNVFVSSQSTNTVDLLGLNSGQTSYIEATNFPVSGGGLMNPTAISADGARNVWVANNSTGLSNVSEFSVGGTALSPTGGFTKDSGYLVNGRSILVDAGGNVWISRDGSTSITEIIGAGVPLYQPASVGIAQGRFQTLP